MATPEGSGWIKLHRQLQDHWLYEEKRVYSNLEAWIDLLLQVNHTEVKLSIKGILFEVKRGESINSLETWAKRWKWNKSKTRRFLILLQKENMIEYKNETQTIRITVCNYDRYQDNRNADETHMKRRRNANETQMKSNKNDKNVKKEKKEKKENIYPATPEGENFNFNTPEKISIEQQLDIKIFWEALLKIYNPVGDRSLVNTVLKKQREKIIRTFTAEEREKILEWFGKYKTQLEIANTWLGTFFRDHPTIETIAEYFRSIKDIKETKENKVNNYGIKQTRNFDDYEITPKK